MIGHLSLRSGVTDGASVTGRAGHARESFATRGVSGALCAGARGKVAHAVARFFVGHSPIPEGPRLLIGLEDTLDTKHDKAGRRFIAN